MTNFSLLHQHSQTSLCFFVRTASTFNILNFKKFQRNCCDSTKLGVDIIETTHNNVDIIEIGRRFYEIQKKISINFQVLIPMRTPTERIMFLLTPLVGYHQLIVDPIGRVTPNTLCFFFFVRTIQFQYNFRKKDFNCCDFYEIVRRYHQNNTQTLSILHKHQTQIHNFLSLYFFVRTTPSTFLISINFYAIAAILRN
ncbi:hypothetical protein KSS87_014117, partial [Heliosperma pusillum]